MFRRAIFGVVSITFAAAVIAGAIYLSSQTVTADEQVWISIDESELNVITKEFASEKNAATFEVSTVLNGIAVVRTDRGALELLSEKMHKNFVKCSGFIVHPNQTEALTSIENSFSNGNERLVDYTIDNQSTVNQLIPAVTEPGIRDMIVNLSSYDTRRHDSESGLFSANYINFRWGQLAVGRSDMSVQMFSNSGFGSTSTPQPSIILTITGTEFPDEIVVLGAHQDSIRSGSTTLPAPGADDDASGVATLTEIIRVIKEKDFHPKRTVQFIAYAAEEVGLWGSKNITANYTANNRNVIGAMQFDMTNFTGVPSIDIGIITDFTNAAQNQFVHNLISEYLPEVNVVDTACGYACSDHAPWNSAGVPVSFPFESSFAGLNNALHTANDTISQSNSNADHAVNFGKLGLAYIAELAKGSVPLAPTGAKFDFDGDSKSDVSIFRPSAGEWWYLRSSDNADRAFAFGSSSDKMVPADFTGDGKADIAFWKESTGEWFVLRSEDSSYYSFPFGAAGDIPTTGDFDGDGKADPAVFRGSTGTWFILNSGNGQTSIVPFGTDGDRPIVGDYDNDGKDDVAIFRPSASQWWLNRSTAGVIAFQFGNAGDIATVADFTGDGTDDKALWRPSTGEWFILRSDDDTYYAFPFGANGDVPSVGDFDGDGTADPTVFRASDATWYSLQSTNGAVFTPFGAAGDLPAPGAYLAQ
ncbi:MAG: M20/M25/M40 family metallo-hydrolase [Pyrinomonadaceae bacterium]